MPSHKKSNKSDSGRDAKTPTDVSLRQYTVLRVPLCGAEGTDIPFGNVSLLARIHRRGKGASQGTREYPEGRTVFVCGTNGVENVIGEHALRHFMTQFGRVESITTGDLAHASHPTGTAHVIFKSASSARRCIAQEFKNSNTDNSNKNNHKNNNKNNNNNKKKKKNNTDSSSDEYSDEYSDESESDESEDESLAFDDVHCTSDPLNRRLSSNFLTRWQAQCRVHRSGRHLLRSLSNKAISRFEEIELEREQERLENWGKPDDDGWVKVERAPKSSKKRNKNAVPVPANSGAIPIAFAGASIYSADNNGNGNDGADMITGVGHTAVNPNRKARNRKKASAGSKPILDFYKFQHRENKREEVAELRKKFEEDTKKLERLKKERRFKPY